MDLLIFRSLSLIEKFPFLAGFHSAQITAYYPAPSILAGLNLPERSRPPSLIFYDFASEGSVLQASIDWREWRSAEAERYTHARRHRAIV